jgi:glycerol kinase
MHQVQATTTTALRILRQKTLDLRGIVTRIPLTILHHDPVDRQHIHKLPLSALPQVHSSSQVYATLSRSYGVAEFDLIPLAAMLGDQQAALFGQRAFELEEAKNTYGTGLFLMMNTGTEIIS